MNEPQHICTETQTLGRIERSLQRIEIALFDPTDGIQKHLKETREILHGKDGNAGVLELVRKNTDFRRDMRHIGKKISAGFAGLVAWLVKVQFFTQ